MKPGVVPVIRHNPDPDFDDGSAVLRALAQEPSAVVYDLTIHNEALSQLGEVLDTIDAYLILCPGTALLVCTTEPSIASALGAHPLGARVIIVSSMDGAMAAAKRLPALDRFSLELDPVPTAPRQARQLVSRSLARWQAPELVGPAWSVITELVANAVIHAGSPITASISRLDRDHGAVRLAVRDENDGLPVLIAPTQAPTDGGHGIWIVENISQGWGTVPLHPGKIVWAVLDARALPEEPDEPQL